MANRGLACIMVMTMIVSTTLVIAEDNQTYRVGFPEINDGDYLVMSVEISGMKQMMIEDSQEDEYPIVEIIVNENSPMNMTLTNRHCYSITSSSYCSGSMDTWTINMTSILESGSDYEDDRIIQQIVMESRTEIANGTTYESMDMALNTWFIYDGDQYHVEYEESIVEEKQLLDEKPQQVSVGDSWVIRSESQVSITSKYRLNGGDWDIEQTEEDWTNTTNYVAESNGNIFVDGQPIDSLRIKSQEIGHSDYRVRYVSELGIPLKLEVYDDDGTLDTISTLIDYCCMKLENEPVDESKTTPESDEVGRLPGFGILMTLSAISLVALMHRRNS